MRRNTNEMKLKVLEVLNTPRILTHIMYKANVNCSVLKPMLKELEVLGLVRRVDPAECRSPKKGRVAYKRTELGYRVLKEYTAVVEKLTLLKPS